MIRISEHTNYCYVCKEEVLGDKKTEIDKRVYVCSQRCLIHHHKLLCELTMKLKLIRDKPKTPTPEG